MEGDVPIGRRAARAPRRPRSRSGRRRGARPPPPGPRKGCSGPSRAVEPLGLPDLGGPSAPRPARSATGCWWQVVAEGAYGELSGARRRRGLGREMVRAALDRVAPTSALERPEALVPQENVAPARLLEGAGFRFPGLPSDPPGPCPPRHAAAIRMGGDASVRQSGVIMAPRPWVR